MQSHSPTQLQPWQLTSVLLTPESISEAKPSSIPGLQTYSYQSTMRNPHLFMLKVNYLTSVIENQICYLSLKFSLLYVIINISRRRQWHPTPILLPGKSHGRRSLVGHSPWSRKESDTTEHLPFTHCTHSILYHWRRKWQPPPVFLPGESHGWRSLASRGPWGHRESDTTEVTEHAGML